MLWNKVGFFFVQTRLARQLQQFRVTLVFGDDVVKHAAADAMA
jgi:hypothetical protein